ncbi:HlyD family type I secretion periplasmic adaptor subunit [Bosea sp. BH3]|uniref:HlyD family type I secretion periplasmic adaptor subunit n=1 Tax=Bosea sp. BH3 TaxID=2871701 RepID=UPI0021CB6F62|nr:HlyD family type I secretion periplasmic adaptor subunit [Bosea sp. BH3]
MNALNFDRNMIDTARILPETGRRPQFSLRSHIVAGIALTLVLVLGFGGWAATARLAGAVVGQGVVKVDQNVKEIQHRDGGIVKSIAVRQGDAVEEGQIVLRLEDIQIRTELSIIRSQLAENLGRRSRLTAERGGLATMPEVPGLASISEEAEQIIAGERRLFEGNKQNRDSRKELLEITIIQSGEEVKGLEARGTAKNEELRLVEMERKKYLSLFEKGFIDGVKVFNINREWARLLGERGEIDTMVARARLRINEARLQIMAVDETARTEAQRELNVVETKISELSDRRAASEDRLARTEIRSPVSGIINELSVFTVGGVLTPAAKVATVVPRSATLIVEVRIAPADIDQMQAGQPARLRFAAFNRNTTPELPGRVRHISPATSRDPQSGASYYVAEVELTEEGKASLVGKTLVPGMPVEVLITTEDRTALSYLVKPVLDHAHRVFRER